MTGLEISASCDAMLEEEEPRTMLKVIQWLSMVINDAQWWSMMINGSWSRFYDLCWSSKLSQFETGWSRYHQMTLGLWVWGSVCQAEWAPWQVMMMMMMMLGGLHNHPHHHHVFHWSLDDDFFDEHHHLLHNYHRQQLILKILKVITQL